jgi:hypothetical protein
VDGINLGSMFFKRWRFCVGIVLLLVAVSASAVSLGRLRGAAFVGRGLDVSVQVTLDNHEAVLESNCFNAEVFYGETRISPNSLSLSVQRSVAGEVRVRIRSSTLVDEPIVTIFLRANCSSTISRRYVLLSEALPENEAAQAAGLSPLSLPSPLQQTTVPAASASQTEATSSAAQRRTERVQKRIELREAKRNKALEKPVSPVAPVGAVEAIEPKKAIASRLKLDLLDLTSSEPSLRGSYELSSTPSTDQAVRNQALALWRALNASPEQSQRDLQRLDSLELQYRSSLENSKRLENDVVKLSTDLMAAQGERYLNPLTVSLGVFAFLALGLLAWAWRRNQQASGQPWWGAKTDKTVKHDEQQLWAHMSDQPDWKAQSSLSSAKARKSAASHSKTTPIRSNATTLEASPVKSSDPVSAGVSASALSASANSQASPPIAPSSAVIRSVKQDKKGARSSGSGSGRSGFGLSDFGTSSSFSPPRVVAAEELFDIQEQADFFLSLDQPDQAIEVLKNHITDSVEVSALSYMDLFDIYHRTQKRAEYTELRQEFNRVFNAQVPDFDEYGTSSLGLEGEPEVLRSIQEAWTDPVQAQDLIEESIFRQPGQDHMPMDMLAYRELMLLYSLAKELGRPEAGLSMLPNSAHTEAISKFAGWPESTDFLMGEDFSFENSQISTSLEASKSKIDQKVQVDATQSLTPALKNDGVDFDLSDAALSGYKLPNTDKKS